MKFALRCSFPQSVLGALGLALTALGFAPSPVRAQARPALPAPNADLPLVVVRLTRPVYVIRADAKTGEPQMPRDVTAFAEVVGWPVNVPKPTGFVWRASVDWNFAPFPTHHSIGNETISHASPCAFHFGNEIRGGTLTVYAKTFLNGQPVFGMAQAQIVAENPSRAAIFRALPPSRFGLIASKVAVVESGLKQFACAPGQAGWPVVSRTNDVGLMQLNAPSGALSSPDQVWDWRANLQHGLEMLVGKRRISVLASRHAMNLTRMPETGGSTRLTVLGLNLYRGLVGMSALNLPVPPPLNYAPGSGVQSSEPDPDRVALNQFEREMIRRYNGGREYTFTVVADPNTLTLRGSGWQVDPTRGGISARSGDPNYVLHVLSAHSGYVIPKPIVKTKHGKRGRHHGRRRHH